MKRVFLICMLSLSSIINASPKLLEAVKAGELHKVLEAWKNPGRDPYYVERDSTSCCLNEAITLDDYHDILRFLLVNGVDPNCGYSNVEYSPLMEAIVFDCSHENSDCPDSYMLDKAHAWRMLLFFGADVEIVWNYLHHADNKNVWNEIQKNKRLVDALNFYRKVAADPEKARMLILASSIVKGNKGEPEKITASLSELSERVRRQVGEWIFRSGVMVDGKEKEWEYVEDDTWVSL